MLIILLRILGKREVGELSIFDLVVLLIIADIASLGVDNNDFFVGVSPKVKNEFVELFKKTIQISRIII